MHGTLSTEFLMLNNDDVRTDHAIGVLLEVSRFPSRELKHQDSIHPAKIQKLITKVTVQLLHLLEMMPNGLEISDSGNVIKKTNLPISYTTCLS